MSDAGRRPAGWTDEREPWRRAKIRVLLRANRLLLAGVVLLGLFAAFVALGALAPVSLREAMAAGDPVDTLFQALVTAIVTGVTLVVTINQVVLSQELGPLGDQNERMERTMSFRYDVESTLSLAVSPAEPSAFLGSLLEGVRSRAATLRESVGPELDRELRERMVAFAEDVERDAASSIDRLEDAAFGTFDVVDAALSFTYSPTLYEARRLNRTHDESLPAETRAALRELTEVLGLFSPAREHVKTLYFRWELVNLSRIMLYASVPALLVTIATVLYVDAGTVTESTLGVDHLVWLVSAAVTVALLPFALLLSYILRIATVAQWTLAIGPFVLEDTTRSS